MCIRDSHHSGPVIMAGDFNAWSRPRMNALYRFAREMSLREVRFSDDQRRRAFGRPLDFVFYRGLSVHDASVLSLIHILPRRLRELG